MIKLHNSNEGFSVGTTENLKSRFAKSHLTGCSFTKLASELAILNQQIHGSAADSWTHH